MFFLEPCSELDLKVVAVSGWKRGMSFEATGLQWHNPSPIMNGPKTALLYPGVALLEFEIATGRGTDFPFEKIGAPYIKKSRLLRQMRSYQLKGVHIEEDKFTPSKGHFETELCEGLKFEVTDSSQFDSAALGLALGHALYKLYPRKFSLERYNVLLLNKQSIDSIKNDESFAKIHNEWKRQSQEFRQRRNPFLLYK